MGNQARLREIHTRARELGLDACSPEIGPQLRLQYSDQPRGEKLYVGMDPIIGWHNVTKIFTIKCTENGKWLESSLCDWETLFAGTAIFVFARPTK